MELYDLKTDNKFENINIGGLHPVFSWRVKTSLQNVLQYSYRIYVWDKNKDLVWDSGHTLSDLMGNIQYNGHLLNSGERFEWRVECIFTYGEELPPTDRKRSMKKCCADSFFETGYLYGSDWKGDFIGENSDGIYHLYRKTFSSHAGLSRAEIYVCGLGHFEGFMNGRRLSDNVLETGWSDYNKTCFYSKYDVTRLILNGENCMLFKLGDGMYNVPGGRYVYYPRSYGKCKLLVQLEMVYNDGRKELVISDSSWKRKRSPIKFCCIYGGEDYDEREWKEEYLTADYIEEEELWENAVSVEPPCGTLKAMPAEPVKVMEIYFPVSVRNVADGVWQYDFGVNFSGRVRLKLRTDSDLSGSSIVITPAEMLGDNGRIDQRITDNNYYWKYILNEKRYQEFAPDFTYTGFRYVEISKAVPVDVAGKEISELPVIEKITGEFIYTDAEAVGNFECSNTLFNDIHKIIIQAIKSNTKSYFTDCPHREKLPWLEETHLIGPSIMYNFDVHNLYIKIEQDMEDSQHENGLVPDICPEYTRGFEKWNEGFVDSPEWGSACIINPWYVYRRYGDTVLLEEHYGMMKKYLKYLDSRTHHEVLHHGLGDWLDIGPCPPRSQNTPPSLVATCIYYYDLKIMRSAAHMLGYFDDEDCFCNKMQRVYDEYNCQFLDTQTACYANGSQTAQAMSLMAGLVPPEYEEEVAKQLKRDILNRGYITTAGDIGHPFVVAALIKYRMSDVLNSMTNVVDRPGYGYQVINGSTTLNEAWDGSNPKNRHGSLNHLMLGSIDEWFYAGLGGIELVRKDSSINEIYINPQPEEGVDWVKARTMHPCGPISVEWEKKEDEVLVCVEIPPNVRAHLMSWDSKEEREVGSGKYFYNVPFKSLT